MYNLYVGHWNLTTDILHNLSNAERIPFSLYFLSQKITPLKQSKSKNIMFIVKEFSHDIVESSRYIPRDRSHMRTSEMDLNSGAFMTPKKRTTDAQAKRVWVYLF